MTTALFTLLPHKTHADPPPPTEFDLKKTTQFALEHSPTLHSSQIRKQIAEWDTSNRKAAFLPSLDIDSTHGLQKDHRPTETEPWVSNLQLKLSESLYDNGESITRYRLAKTSEDLANLQLLKDRDQLILHVIQQFYNFSKAFRAAEARQEQKAILKKQFESLSFQYTQGQRLRKDFLRLKAEVQRAEIEGRSADTTLEKSKWELRRLIGTDETKVFSPLDASRLSPDFSTTTPSVQSTWEYKIAKMEQNSKPLNVDLANQKFWPNIKLTSSAYYGTSNYINKYSVGERENYGANIMLNISFNIWDWGTLSREVEKARAQENISKNDLRKIELDLSAELKGLVLDLNELKANYGMSVELLKDQEEAFRILQRDYREGQASYTEYVEGLSNLISAKILYSNARFDLATTIAKKNYFEGTLYEVATK